MGLGLVMIIVVAATLAPAEACPPSDRAALMAFKAALHEPHLGIFNSWTGTDCCKNWYGVSCDQGTRRVADINLRGESEDPIFERAHRTGYMTGYISPAICKLPRLSSITIADWKESPELRRLTVLNIADNLISGPIPASITNLSSLMHLDLRNNRISGGLPRDFHRLGMLSRALLSRNQISGTIPPSISSIYRLADLDLSLNRLEGPIPESLGKMAVLATLNLDGNMVSGIFRRGWEGEDLIEESDHCVVTK
ncbi:hypothetical protein F8388_018124 [Cannabis sativa]|uniref:Leucine-rich repeat-containing N-terminal plant-type domain-containing protein n=1 Tax=Cannabis sativa TaxID=3483 RepID=A0A7J6HN03_CANSA|nr:hypothetical protein F8388_018124 [Cannabis sativa]